MIPRKVSHRQAICLGALMGRRWKNLWCNGLHQAPAQSTKPSAKHQAPVQSPAGGEILMHSPPTVCVLQRMNSTSGPGLLLAKMAVNFLSMSTHADLRVSNGETQNWWEIQRKWCISSWNDIFKLPLSRVKRNHITSPKMLAQNVLTKENDSRIFWHTNYSRLLCPSRISSQTCQSRSSMTCTRYIWPSIKVHLTKYHQVLLIKY